ncbi:hypothetical protein SKAU_G00295730 [Synaphobranchus kaupii]|uniref:Uncharacterized protein n=1 Tax=Synaphobranchus kaupii TaxID=118154 RepID=A0A9Q1EUT0_SYNKA|nr:hypothetical protein SKAU_G00295730 [Synaphobranchus kaupii]
MEIAACPVAVEVYGMIPLLLPEGVEIPCGTTLPPRLGGAEMHPIINLPPRKEGAEILRGPIFIAILTMIAEKPHPLSLGVMHMTFMPVREPLGLRESPAHPRAKDIEWFDPEKQDHNVEDYLEIPKRTLTIGRHLWVHTCNHSLTSYTQDRAPITHRARLEVTFPEMKDPHPVRISKAPTEPQPVGQKLLGELASSPVGGEVNPSSLEEPNHLCQGPEVQKQLTKAGVLGTDTQRQELRHLVYDPQAICTRDTDDGSVTSTRTVHTPTKLGTLPTFVHQYKIPKWQKSYLAGLLTATSVVGPLFVVRLSF